MYSPPADTLATTLTTIKSPNYNAFVNDVAADLNLARPIVSGGTGATSVASAQSALSLDNKVVYASKSGNYTALATDNNAAHRYTAAATVTLTAAATLGSNWHYTVTADGGAVTIDPNASETINGLATLTVPNGSSATIICDGSNFFTVIRSSPWETISVASFSVVANVDFTNLSAYRKLRLTVDGTNSATAGIYIQSSTNNGSSFDSGASDYTIQNLGIQGAGVVGTAVNSTALNLSGTAVDASTSWEATVNIGMFNAAANMQVTSQFVGVSTSLYAEWNGARRNSTTARNALRLLVGSGTMTGQAVLEGLRG